MRKILMTLAAVVCCAMVLSVFTAYGNKEESATSETSKDSMAVVINLDSIVIKPYLAFGSTLTDVEKYMTENFADFAIVNANALIESMHGSFQTDLPESKIAELINQQLSEGTDWLILRQAAASGEGGLRYTYSAGMASTTEPDWYSVKKNAARIMSILEEEPDIE